MSVDPIGITAHDGEIIDVNPAWLHLFGYKEEYGFKGVVTKPYNPNELMEAIDTVLREC